MTLKFPLEEISSGFRGQSRWGVDLAIKPKWLVKSVSLLSRATNGKGCSFDWVSQSECANPSRKRWAVSLSFLKIWKSFAWLENSSDFYELCKMMIMAHEVSHKLYLFQHPTVVGWMLFYRSNQNSSTFFGDIAMNSVKWFEKIFEFNKSEKETMAAGISFHGFMICLHERFFFLLTITELLNISTL